MSNDNWRTPDWMFKWLDNIYGPFDIDLAASAENAKCDQFYTWQDNALMQDWRDHATNGFCNPPYSTIASWPEKARQESCLSGFKSTLVLPVFNGKVHWLDSALNYAAAEITIICGRVAFLNDQGHAIQGNRQGSIIVHYNGAFVPTGRPNIKYVKRDALINLYGPST